MSLPLVEQYMAAGFSEPEAITRWYAHHLRDTLNELRTAVEWSRWSVSNHQHRSDAEQQSLDALRLASLGRLEEMRFDLARECDAWFEVRQ